MAGDIETTIKLSRFVFRYFLELECCMFIVLGQIVKSNISIST